MHPAGRRWKAEWVEGAVESQEAGGHGTVGASHETKMCRFYCSGKGTCGVVVANCNAVTAGGSGSPIRHLVEDAMVLANRR
ncbi:MAG: hypothetical protein FJX77_18260 [Armatimonadetes bacterium]|nr:hypothetical protein [Armatimonadota bacterium]